MSCKRAFVFPVEDSCLLHLLVECLLSDPMESWDAQFVFGATF